MKACTPTLPHILYDRPVNTHKGDYGHALLIAGSYGKAGAAILAARAALRSGVGLLTVHVPRLLVPIIQTAVPEAMISVDSGQKHITKLPSELQRFNVIGMGPGLGTEPDTRKVVAQALQMNIPTVVDADALNAIAIDHIQIPAHTILTPHDGEYARLFANAETETVSKDHNCIIVRKGHQSKIYAPDGQCHINHSGNPGMATAGSGDVLTGIITALRAQDIEPFEAAKWGVYLHGCAADMAIRHQSQASLIASDIIDYLKEATRPNSTAKELSK